MIEPYGDDIFTEPDLDPDGSRTSGRSVRWPACGRACAAPTITRSGPARTRPRPRRWRARRTTCSSSTTSCSRSTRRRTDRSCFYGLRYHIHIVKPGEVETFHDQVGYWLWEAQTQTVTQSLAIPRAQVALASGPAAADAKEFELNGGGRGRCLRDPVEPVHQRRVPHDELPDPRHDPRRRHVVVRGRHRDGDPGPRPSRSTTSIATPCDASRRRRRIPPRSRAAAAGAAAAGA